MSPSTPPGLTTTMTTMTSTRHMSSAVSFDRAGSSSLQQLPSSSRLPSYRSSYCGRYHPYGRRVSRKDKEVDLMKTIDMRFDNRASLSLSVVDEEDEDELEGEGEDVEIESTTAVSPSNEGGDYQPPTSHRLGKPIMARRRTLTNIVIEFAFAMRRSLQRKKPNLLFSKRS